MKKYIYIPLLAASMLVASTGLTSHTNTVQASSDQLISVKLQNYLRDKIDKTQLNVDVSGTYQLVNDERITLTSENEYTVKLEGGELNLYKGSSKLVKNASELSFTPAIFSSKTLKGDTRYDTSVAIAKEGWSNTDAVVLGRGDIPVDALTGSVLAQKYDAPLLLTKSKEVPEAVINQINAHSPETIYILGGPGAISANIEKQLEKEYKVVRIKGDTREATAVEIAENIGDVSTVFITSGDEESPDALSIASYAAKNQMPILLNRGTKLNTDVKAYLKNNSISKVYVIGGEVAVPQNVIESIKNVGISNVERVKGSDRYETSIEIAEEFDFDTSNVFFAQGQIFIDALPGAVLAAEKNAPVILTRKDYLPSEAEKWMKTIGVPYVYFLGGNGAIDTDARQDIKQAIVGNATDTFISINNRPYLGDMKFTNDKGTLRPINTLPFETYLKGVVPYEMPASWQLEALKAQAVAARTYALNLIEGKQNPVIVDTVSNQVYGGYVWLGTNAYENSNKAVEQTAGKVLRYNGKLISALFSSSNGGHTESNSNYWGTAQVPYLVAKPDTFDPENPWKIEIDKVQIDTSNLDLTNPDKWWNSVEERYGSTATLNYIKKHINDYYYGNTDIKIVGIPEIIFKEEDKNKSGKYSGDATGKLVVDFFVKDKDGTYRYVDGKKENGIKKYTMKKDFTVEAFRSMFGGNKFKSYHVENVTDKDGKLSINGLGYGHGVGMSQYGAQYRAKDGQTYDEILEFYYPNTVLGK